MLSAEQLGRFATDGYLVVPDVVPEELLVAAEHELHSVVAAAPPLEGTVGKHFYFIVASLLPNADAALRKSRALAIAEELVAPHRLDHAKHYGHIQIALNIASWEHVPGGPHLDGYHDPDRPHPFTMLAGIFLTDETSPNAGNLYVWPGSHLVHAEMFTTRGVDALMSVGGHPTMLDPPMELGAAIAVLAKRGDLLLAHYLLGHNTGGNTTMETRRMLYYRLGCTSNEGYWAQAMTDPFFEYEPARP